VKLPNDLNLCQGELDGKRECYGSLDILKAQL